MESKFENGVLTIYLEGNVDTSNADEIGKEIDEIRAANQDGGMTLDVKKLNYISSAGLRQILRLKKKESDFKIINCSADIYDIFEMTGFSEIIDIEKAFRELSVDGCEVIGEGSNGIVYRISDDTIIKVYKNNDALKDIKRERDLAKTAFVSGINTAIPFDVVKVDGKYGAVYEMLQAKSITKYILANPDDKDKYIKIYVDLLKDMHSKTIEDGLLPSAKQASLDRVKFYEGKIEDDRYQKLLSLVEGIEERHGMIHGDFHTSNVHYNGEETILIDMDTISTGHPIFDLAAIYSAYCGFSEINHDNVKNFLNIDWDLAQYILNKIFELYFEGKDKAYIDDVLNKVRVLSYARILRRTMKRTADKVDEIAYYKKRLYECMDLINDLAF